MLFLCISLSSSAKGTLPSYVCLRECTGRSEEEKGVRGGKAEAVSVGTKTLDWADMRDSFHWKIAQR